FFKKQICFPTPPRFVKFSFCASSLTHGESKTVPTRDHVPELINAQSSPVAGIAAIADAGSWHAGKISCVLRNEERSLKSPRIAPAGEPLGTISGADRTSSPNS